MKEEILKTIIYVIKACEDLDPLISPDKITQQTVYQADLGFDSLALMSILYELQEIYPEIEETEIEKWETLKDTVESVVKHVPKSD